MARPTVFDISVNGSYTGYILTVTYANGSQVFGRTARAPFTGEYPGAYWPVLAKDGNLYEVVFTNGSGDCTGVLKRWNTEWGGADPAPAVDTCTVTLPGEDSSFNRARVAVLPYSDSVVGLFQVASSPVAVMRPGLSASLLVGSALPIVWQAYDAGAACWINDVNVGLTTVGVLI